MIRGSQKLGSILGCMRWRLLQFSAPVVAYSDQPVFLWPLTTQAIDKRPTTPKLGPVNALELRVPLSPRLILLMTWDDQSDGRARIPATVDLAADTNALVIAQADKPWMHQAGGEPPISSRLIAPISSGLDPGYTIARSYAQAGYARLRSTHSVCSTSRSSTKCRSSPT